jgi:hypothetical protein
MAVYRAAIWGFVFVEATALLALMVWVGSIGAAVFLLIAAPLLLLLWPLTGIATLAAICSSTSC